jgi:hypothetical protein
MNSLVLLEATEVAGLLSKIDNRFRDTHVYSVDILLIKRQGSDQDDYVLHVLNI